MREILFKAKRKDNNEWVYGYLQKQAVKDEEYYITSPYNELINESHVVIPETISQYTGLKDKNGVKIFENDRVKLHYTFETYSSETSGAYINEKDISGVVSLMTPLGLYINTGDEYQNYIWEYLYNLSLKEYPEQIEVIGNIFDKE